MKSTDILQKNFESSIKAKSKFISNNNSIIQFKEASEAVLKCYKNGGRLYLAGNGGSAADAQHIAAEFVSKLSIDRDSLPAEALTVDSSVLTAIGNDYGYENIFSRQIFSKLRFEDIFLAITTSGNSMNIIKALEECRKKNIQSILFTGNDGGKAKNLSTFPIIVENKSTQIIQEIHIMLGHSLCQFVETSLFNNEGKRNEL